MPRIEFDVEDYTIEMETSADIEPTDERIDRLVQRTEKFNEVVDLGRVELEHISGGEYDMEVSTQDGRLASQTITVEPDRVLLTWSMDDQFSIREVTIYNRLREAMLELVREYEVTVLTVAY